MASGKKQASLGLRLVTPQKHIPIRYTCMVCGQVSEEDCSLCSQCGSLQSYAPNSVEIETDNTTAKRKRAQKASDVPRFQFKPHPTGRSAWDEALGGGLVRPSTVLVHGPKGTGKTTAMLHIATSFARKFQGYALYGTAEMSSELLRHYAERIGVDLKRLLIQDAGDTENMLSDIEEFQPVVVVWDSVQAFSWDGATGETELRNTLRAGIRSSASYEHTALFISQVTKDNDFLGPSELGHGVDVVLTLQRKKNVLLVECPEKNRFAPTPRTGKEFLPEDIPGEKLTF